MKTMVVKPADEELRSALRLGSGFAVFTVLLHVALTLWVKHEGYGYFRDELYYLICGRHLAWGYVDHGPLVAVQARLAERLFGKSLVGLRMFSAIAGGIRVLLTGLLAWALGGRRAAQCLAMIGVTVAACYLGGDSYLSMNSVESTFWMGCLLALILIERGSSERWWLVFGALAGLGLLNKPDMTFFLTALLLALLLTPQRRLLRSWWMLAGVGLMLLIVMPYLVWQVHNDWPTWEFLQNGRAHHKNVVLGPFAFLMAQVNTLLPASCWRYTPRTTTSFRSIPFSSPPEPSHGRVAASAR
jgi:4-amino-4-deoxy-L-arabinose transferase-like glycosyltransferase